MKRDVNNKHNIRERHDLMFEVIWGLNSDANNTATYMLGQTTTCIFRCNNQKLDSILLIVKSDQSNVYYFTIFYLY